MKIQVNIRSVYGRDLIYPVDDNAKKFTRLVDQATLSNHHIDIIKSLGVKVEIVHNLTAGVK